MNLVLAVSFQPLGGSRRGPTVSPKLKKLDLTQSISISIAVPNTYYLESDRPFEWLTSFDNGRIDIGPQ
jgi:hypothetical protein